MVWTTVSWTGALVLGYLLGSIPAAYIAGRALTGRDIREEGDHNPGAGNTYRTIGPVAGVLVGVVDLGKGAVAVLLAKVITGSTEAAMVAGVAVVVGHSWPVFLRLRGGRGAASTVGVFIALVPIPGIPLSLLSLALLPIIRSATLALTLIMVPLPFLAWLTGASSSVVVYSVCLPVGVGIRHYLTSRKLRPPEQDQAGGQVLPQEP